MTFTITRSLGFDYGHRVMTHGSKCRNIHGHRGTIEATCSSVDLHAEGEQKDMTLDFGFLKEILMDVVDASIDHGFIASIDDLDVLAMFSPKAVDPFSWREGLKSKVSEAGFCLTTNTRLDMKLYVVPFVPTAERLAEHFFNRLLAPIKERSNGLAQLTNIRFWETPNCCSDYPGTASNPVMQGREHFYADIEPRHL